MDKLVLEKIKGLLSDEGYLIHDMRLIPQDNMIITYYESKEKLTQKQYDYLKFYSYEYEWVSVDDNGDVVFSNEDPNAPMMFGITGDEGSNTIVPSPTIDLPQIEPSKINDMLHWDIQKEIEEEEGGVGESPEVVLS